MPSNRQYRDIYSPVVLTTGHAEVQIDHILVDARKSSSILDCQVYKGVENGIAHSTIYNESSFDYV